MSALPYMPLYVADYLADTSHLSAIENGAYLLLIMNYWQRGNSLPCGDDQLARVCRLTTKEWSKVKTTLCEFFDEEDGFWIHDRIETELLKVREKSIKASNAGKVSAQRKTIKPPTDDQQTPNERSTSVEQAFNHTDTYTDTEEKKEPKKVLSKENRGTRMSDTFQPDASCSKLADELGLSNEQRRNAIENFVDYWKGIPGQRGCKLDWQATFRNQIRHVAKTKGGALDRNFTRKPNSIDEAFDSVSAALRAEREALEREEAGEVGKAGTRRQGFEADVEIIS